jgi:hypothetical protein
MRRIAVALVVVLVLGLALELAACGSSDQAATERESDATRTAGDTTTYTNDEYGFSITYPARFEEGESTSASEAGSDAVFSIGFADPDGTIVDGMTVDGLQVAVYQLTREVTADEVAGLEAEFQGVVDQMMAGLQNATIENALGAVELNGVPGFGFSYTYTSDGTDLRASTFFLVEGSLEYQLTAQASLDEWDALAPELEAAAMSFTVD